MKVLLVDDHSVVRSGLSALLTSAADFDVLEAADGREAMARLRQIGQTWCCWISTCRA